MRRRSTTIRFIVEASHVIHNMVVVISSLERGAAMRAVGTATRRVASWRMRVTSLKMEFVIAPLRFVDETKSAMMSSSQG